MRTTVTFEGRLASNPDLTITQNGKSIVTWFEDHWAAAGALRSRRRPR
jgi:single-stranded DNA-binding protein